MNRTIQLQEKQIEGWLFTLGYGAIGVTWLHCTFSAGSSKGVVLASPFLRKLDKSLERRGLQRKREEAGRGTEKQMAFSWLPICKVCAFDTAIFGFLRGVEKFFP